jgi:hypothetical protein
VNVTTPAGIWNVRRRWAPRHLGQQTIWARFLDRTQKVRRRTADLGDLPDPGCAPDIAEGIVAFLVIVALVLFLVFVGIPLLIALGELLFIVVLAVVGVVGRVLFRRPWTVDAIDPGGARRAWSIVGWRPSRDARRLIADRIAATGSVPTDDEVSAAAVRG